MQSFSQGILLFESTSLTPIYADDQAIQILTHAANSPMIASWDGFLGRIVQPRLKRSSGQSVFVDEFRVGESAYSCRTFLLTAPSRNSGNEAGILLVMLLPA